MGIVEQANAIQDDLIRWRRDFHQHPELGFQEFRTAKAIAAELTTLGYEVQTGVAKTGIVARIGEGRPAIGIRADMDALPILEENDQPYASQNSGVMHACGHDAHSAILLGVARLLAEQDDLPAGEIRLLFQPSEEAQDDENKSGGMRMVEEGALDGLDATLSVHVYSDQPAGQIYVIDGYATANSDSFTATIYGDGGHGAYPHKGTDPVFIATQVLNRLYAIPSRYVDPLNPAVISIGGIKAGTVTNVIPSEVDIMGTMRSYDKETRILLREQLTAAFDIANQMGGSYDLNIMEGYPASYHDPAVAGLIRDAATDLYGPDVLGEGTRGMGAEDFSYMLEKAPGAMMILGAKLDEVDRGHHTPVFDIDESSLAQGTAILTEAAIRLLKEHGV